MTFGTRRAFECIADPCSFSRSASRVAFLGHAVATLAKCQVPEAEQRDVVAFVQSLKRQIVE